MTINNSDKTNKRYTKQNQIIKQLEADNDSENKWEFSRYSVVIYIWYEDIRYEKSN